MTKPPHDIVFDEATLARRVSELGREIGAAYSADDRLLVVGVLKGSFLFLADLVRAIEIPHQIDFLVVSSYGDRMESSGDVDFHYEPRGDLSGRAILLVEDIVDSGTTLARVIPRLEDRGASRVDVCTLLHKRLAPSTVEPRWVGFDAPKRFLVGYGLDHAEDFRHLPYIASV